MKRILNLLLFGLICLGCFPGYAQKETKEKTEVAYILHPKFPLEKASLTYKVIIDNPFVNKLNIDQAWVNGLEIGGLQKSENPERIVKLEVYDLVDTSYVFTKVMEGNTYSWISKASASIRLYVTDPANNSVYYEFKLNNYPQASKEHKAKSNFLTEEEAKKDLSANRSASSISLLQELTAGVKELLPNILNDYFGTQRITETQVYWSIKSKQYDYTDLDEVNKLYLKGIDQRKAGNDEASNTTFKEYLSKLNELIGQYNPGDKKAKYSVKNIDALYINAALASLWSTDFAGANKYLKLADEVKGMAAHEKQVRDLLERIELGYVQHQKMLDGTLKVEKRIPEDKIIYHTNFLVKNNKWRLARAITYVGRTKVIATDLLYTYNNQGMLTSKKGNSAIGENYLYNNDSLTVRVQQLGVKGILKERRNFQNKSTIDINSINRSNHKTDNFQILFDKEGKWLGYKSVKAPESLAIDYNAAGKMVSATHVYLSSNLTEKGVFYTDKYLYNYSGTALLSVSITKGAGTEKESNYTINMVTDSKGQVTRVSNQYMTYSYEYDEHGNVTKRTTLSDDGSVSVEEFIWEAGSGNLSLVDGQYTGWLHDENPLLFPITDK